MAETANDENVFAGLRAKVKKDPEYKRTLDLVAAMSELDLAELHNEVLEYQRLRGNRAPLALKSSPKKSVVTFSSEDASYRSRISYVRAIARRETNKLQYLVDSCHDWLLHEYAGRVKATVQVKEAFINSLIKPLTTRLSDLESLDDCCVLVLEDIDQSQWQRRAIVSVLEINSRPEGKL